MCILIKKEKGRRRGHFNWTSTFSHLLDIESIGFLREGRRPFMVQVASRLYMFLKHVLRPFLNKVITWVGIGTMFLILTFFKKVAPLLFISDHFFASPCFMMCRSCLLAHHTQSSMLSLCHNFPLRPFGTSSTMRIMEWKHVRKKQWLHRRCGRHCCPFTCLARTTTKLGIPLSGKHLSSIDLDCPLAYWLLTFNIIAILTYTHRRHQGSASGYSTMGDGRSLFQKKVKR